MKNILESTFFNKKVSRKQFLKLFFSALAIAPFLGHGATDASVEGNRKFNGRLKRGIKGKHDLVVVTGDDSYADTVKAVDGLGGMERFVKRADTVLVKPNIGWDRTPEQAGNTNPQVVAALVDMSFKAGAKRVNIFDVTCNDPRRCYESSQIQSVAREHGANVYIPEDWDTIPASFAFNSPMEGWPMLKDAVECDVFINVPILKHHRLTRLTLSMKNLMGVCGGNRGLIHQNIGQKVADLTEFFNPELTIIDAYRVLVRNGPTGGNLEDVEVMKTVIAGTDPVLSDAFASILVGVDPLDVPYIKNAAERNIGMSDVKKADILKVTI